MGNDNIEQLLENKKKEIEEKLQQAEEFYLNTYKKSLLSLIKVGEIINSVEKKLKKGDKSKEFNSWIKSIAENKYKRRLDHARQLAKIGEFAKTNTFLGKNRLLQLDALKTDSVASLVESQPMSDLIKDINNKEEKFRYHVDAIINYYRFENEDISISFEQAQRISNSLKNTLKVKQVQDINKQIELKNVASQEDKDKELNNIIEKIVKEGKYRIQKQPVEEIRKIFKMLVEHVNNINNLEDVVSDILNNMDSSTKNKFENLKGFMDCLEKMSNDRQEQPAGVN